jgi:predicted nucleic-acid-binding protein
MKAERIFADTNLFLRYLTNDVPDQADAVEQLLHRASAGEIVLVINSLVVAEIVWTLESYYGLARDSIKDKVLAILNTPGVEAAEGDLLLQAIFWYADKNIDFIDAFNAAWLLAQGLTTICTFDRKHFSRIEGLEVQVPGE